MDLRSMKEDTIASPTDKDYFLRKHFGVDVNSAVIVILRVLKNNEKRLSHFMY